PTASKGGSWRRAARTSASCRPPSTPSQDASPWASVASVGASRTDHFRLLEPLFRTRTRMELPRSAAIGHPGRQAGGAAARARRAAGAGRLAPAPVADLRQVVAALPDVRLVLDQLVAEGLLGVGRDGAEAGHA